MYIPECGLYANGSPHNADDGDANECESEFVLEISPWYIRTYSDGSHSKRKNFYTLSKYLIIRIDGKKKNN